MEARVLGPVEVLDADGTSVPLTPRLQRLVAALVLAAPDSASTDRLTDAIWGDPAPPTAAKALQGLVSRLRATGGAAMVETVEGGYRLGATVQTDRARFEALAVAARRSEPGRRSTLDDALACWRGQPFAVLDSPAASAESARLEEVVRQLEERRADSLLVTNPSAAVAELERMVERAPLRERRWSLLVDALLADGRPAEALRAYERARGRLVEEVGARPGAELDAAHRRALDATGEAADGPIVDLGWVRPPSALPFVGRDDLVAELATRGRTGRSLQAVVLAGEPGIGKTRTMEEVARAVAGELAVLFGACDPGVRDGMGPLRPLVVRLVGLLGDDRVAELDRSTCDELGRIVPGLADRLDLAPPRPVDADADAGRLAAAVATLVREVARSAPTLVVLDDLHWADDEAVRLLGRVFGELRDAPITVLAGHRHLEPDRNAALVGWLDDVATQGQVGQVVLDGLSAPALGLLAADGAGRAGDGERLRAATGGNPFFVGQVLSAEIADGPTPAVKAVLERHLAAVDEPTARLLRAGAVWGRRFPLREAAVLAEVEPQAIGAAVDAGLVDPGDGDGEQRFHHDLIRDVVLAGMTAVEREDLHWRIAAVPGLAPRDAADHAVAGATTLGRRMEAARLLVAAGEQALRLLLYAEAVHRFDQAIDLLEDRPDPATMASAHIGRSRARYLTGDAPASYADAAQAVRLARPQSATLFADAVLALVGTPEDLNVGEQRAEADCRDALARIPEADLARRARLLAAAAIHRWDRADGHAPVDGDFDEALALSRAAGDGAAEAFVLRARQRAWFEATALDARMAAADRLVEIGAETGDDGVRCWGHRWQVIHGFEVLGPALHDALDRFGALADARGDAFHLWGHRLRSAGVALVEGRARDAAGLAAEAAVIAERLGSSLPVEAGAQLERGQRWLWGDPQGLAEVHATGHAVRGAARSGPSGSHHLAFLVVAGGEQADRLAGAPGDPAPTADVLGTLNAFELDGAAWRAAACRDRALATALVAVLGPLGHQWSSVLPGITALTPLASALGLALEVLDRDDEARLAHRRAVELAEAAGAWPASVHALAHLARVEGRLGDPEAATTRERAEDVAADLGSVAHDLLWSWTLPSPRP